MRVHQRTMIVGLGGSGCRIASDLESNIRAGLCGPDGLDLVRKSGAFSNLTAFELPSFVRFLYADYDQNDLEGVERAAAVPKLIFGKGAAKLDNLVPPGDGYRDVARVLRQSKPNLVNDWLPSPEGEPPVAPLTAGAGQFPTVGRAALFESMRINGFTSLMGRQMERILRELANSGQELEQIRERSSDKSRPEIPNAIDIFVAFSIVGGTGCGIFFDFIHLISNLAKEKFPKFGANIYPLVMLPSVFDEGHGDRHAGRLNTARAALDLFRFIDTQNQNVDQISYRIHDGGLDHMKLEAPVGSVRTAFVFSRPGTLTRAELDRSIVAFVEGLVGTEPEALDPTDGNRQAMSFASEFVNLAALRDSPGRVGIGLRPAASAMAVSAEVPVKEIAAIVASDLAIKVMHDMKMAEPGESARFDERLIAFLQAAGLAELRTMDETSLPPVEFASGEIAVIEALTEHRDKGIYNNEFLSQRLGREIMPRLVAFAGIEAGIQLMRKELQPFSLRRFLDGDPDARDQSAKAGLRSYLEERAQADGPEQAPELPEIRNSFCRTVRTDSTIPSAWRSQFAGWYSSDSTRRWRSAWRSERDNWLRTLRKLDELVHRMVTDLDAYADNEAQRRKMRQERIFDRNVGVQYILPESLSIDTFDQWVQGVLSELKAEHGLSTGAPDTELVAKILEPEGWSGVAEQVARGEASASSVLSARLRARIETFLTRPAEGAPRLQPLETSLQQLVDGAPDQARAASLRNVLAHLVQDSLLPAGDGNVRLFVSYPSLGRNAGIESYLQQHMNLGDKGSVEFVPNGTGKLLVTGVRLLQDYVAIPEIQTCFREWNNARRFPRPGDRLPWRQRVGTDGMWLLTESADRMRIIKAFLTAAWEGLLKVTEGTEYDPHEIVVTLPDDETATSQIRLELSPLRSGLSGWGDLVTAYEDYVINGGSLEIEKCSNLMRQHPRGVLEGRGRGPAEEYVAIRAAGQLDSAAVFEMLPSELRTNTELNDPTMRRVRSLQSFWDTDLAGALSLDWKEGDVNYLNLQVMEKEFDVSSRIQAKVAEFR